MPKTYKAERWKITYTNTIGKELNIRFTYGQISFDTKESAERELALILKNKKENSSNEDYKVESYIANVLIKPIYPFEDKE